MKSTCVIAVLLLPVICTGTTYYLDISVETSGDGSVGSPWKTFNDASTGLDALPGDGAGDTLEVATGEYGQLTGGVWEKAHALALTVQAATGATCRIGNGVSTLAVNLSPAAPTNVNLVLDGFTIYTDNPSPLPTDDGYFHDDSTTMYLANLQNITITNCDAAGCPYRWLTGSVVMVEDCSVVNITGTVVHRSARSGIYLLDGCTDVQIVGCQVYDIGLGDGIRQYPCVYGDILIDRTVIFDCYSPYTNTGETIRYEHFCPYNETKTDDYHPGTNIGMRPNTLGSNSSPTWDSVTIRRTIIYAAEATGPSGYGGATQGIYFYDGWGRNNKLTVEDCLLFCGEHNIWDIYGSDGSTVVLRNNTVIASRDSAQTDLRDRTDVVNWWLTGLSLRLDSTATNWSYVYEYNDLWRARVGSYFPGYTATTFTSKNNVRYSYSTAKYTTSIAWTGSSGSDLWWTWQNLSNYALRGNPNADYYAALSTPWSQLDWTSTPPDYTNSSDNKDYDYSEDVAGSGTYSDGVAGIPEIWTDASIGDFTLSGDVVYMRGNKDMGTYADAGTVSAYSMGTLDVSGFILDDGATSRTSVGCYEGGASIGYPMRPVLVFPFNREYNVATSRTIDWTRGLGAASVNIYMGTNESLVAARDASTLLDSANTATSYDPTLATGTTYYLAIDSIGADAKVTPGLVTSFDTITTESLATPTNLSPADGATGQAISVTLSWDAVANATGYTITKSTNETFGDGDDVESSQAGTSLAWSSLDGQTQYWWRVRATDSTETYTTSAWTYASFTTIGIDDKLVLMLVSP